MLSRRLLITALGLVLLSGAASAQSLPGAPSPGDAVRSAPGPSNLGAPIRDPNLANVPPRRIENERRRADPTPSRPLRSAPAPRPSAPRAPRL